MKKRINKVLSLIICITFVMQTIFSGTALGFVPMPGENNEVWDGTIATEFAGGSGTENDPYEIANGSQLAYLAKIINESVAATVVSGGSEQSYEDLASAYYELTADIELNDETFTFNPDTGLVKMTDETNTVYIGTGIKGDISGSNTTFDSAASTGEAYYASDTTIASGAIYGGTVNGWTPIGCYSGEDIPFLGDFNGNDYNISGIYLAANQTYGFRHGLFGIIGSEDEGSSVKVSNVSVDGCCIDVNAVFGGIASYAYNANITNCQSDYIGFAGIRVGGIVGDIEHYTNITDCQTSGVLGFNYMMTGNCGGIVGTSSNNSLTTQNFIIEGCSNAATIMSAEGSNGCLGGILGSGWLTTISNCSNTGSVIACVNAGGIAGQLYEKQEVGSSIINCYNSGEIKNSAQGYSTGGIIGTLFDGCKVSNSYNVGIISGTGANVGSIAGAKGWSGDFGTIEDSYYLEECAKDGNDTVQNGKGNSALDSTTPDAAGSTTSFNSSSVISSSVTVGSYTGTDLLSALNAGVIIQTTPSDYNEWKADDENSNNGYPVFDVKSLAVAQNSAPTAANVEIAEMEECGDALTGQYNYSDEDNDTEGTSTFKWYRSEDENGTNKAEILGATASTYTVTSDDEYKYLSFEVTPVASSGESTGTAVESECEGPFMLVVNTIAGTGYDGYSGDGEDATSAKLYMPHDVVFDADGNLYIADTYNNVIRKVDTEGIITTVAGNGTEGYSGDGGQATAAQLDKPWGVEIDSSGNLFIADYDNRVVRKVDTSGIITTFAGTGIAGNSGDGGAATSANLYDPKGLEIDDDDNLYIADSYSNVIRKVDTNGIITTVAGTGDQGFYGDGGLATLAYLRSPEYLHIDSSGNMYIADTGNERIRKVDSNGIITTVAGTGIEGYSGDGGEAISAQIDMPRGLTVDDSGNLYIADTENESIRKVDSNGIITTFAGTGSQSEGFYADWYPAVVTRFNDPMGVAVDISGNLYIADSYNRRISKVGYGISKDKTAPILSSTSVDSVTASKATLKFTSDEAGTYYYLVYAADDNPPNANIVKAQGTAVAKGMDKAATSENVVDITELEELTTYKVYAIVVDVTGNKSAVEAIEFSTVSSASIPTISTVVGTGIGGFEGDGGLATSAKINYQIGITADGSGNLYIADNGNKRIRKIDTSGIITTVAGNGMSGYSGDGQAATEAKLNNPWGVAVDGSGNLYIADTSNHRIRKVDTSGIITTVAGRGVAAFTGDNAAATNALINNPCDVALDSSGNLYFSDTNNNRIRKVDTSGIITTVVGTGSGENSGDGGLATSAGIYSPRGITIDGNDNLYIASYFGHCVRKVDTSGIITTVAGTGVNGYSGDDGLATSAQLKGPNGVAVDASGNLYISEVTGRRVRKVDTSGIITTVAGNGTSGNSGDDGPATEAQLASAWGVAIDGSGNLYISDKTSCCIRMVNLGTGDESNNEPTATVWDGTIATEFAGGNGTENEPYQIANGTQLAYLAQQVNAGNSYSGEYFEMTVDIVLNTYTDDGDGVVENDELSNVNGTENAPIQWTTIGIYDSKAFAGTLNGNGYTISGLYINNDSSCQGLFSYIDGAFIEKIGVIDNYIKTSSYGAGGITAKMKSSTIQYCYNAGTIISGRNMSSAIAASIMSGTVQYCYNIGNISSEGNYIGGIAGYNKGTIQYCYNAGSVKSINNGFGYAGIAGSNEGSVSYCYNTGMVTCDSSYFGSIVGYKGDASTTSSCYYDKQMCTKKGIGCSGMPYDIEGSAEAKLTSQMTGTSLEQNLGTATNWVFTDGLYPRLVGMEDTDAAHVSASPVYLANSETALEVESNFTVSTANEVEWLSTDGSKATISEENVTLVEDGDVTLFAERGDIRKVVELTISISDSNSAPTAANVEISGTATVGEELTGSYTYSDADNDTEGTSTFKWYRSEDGNGTNKQVISGATTKKYTLIAGDVDKYISFEVTPVASSGESPGTAAESDYTGPVGKMIQATITYNDVTKTYGDTAFTHIATGGSGTGAFSYISSDETVATIDSSTGSVTLLKAGTTTLTAIKAGDDNYAEASDTCTLTINKKTLTFTATANNKVYDGTLDATGTIDLDGVVGSLNVLSTVGRSSDDVAASATFTFTDANVGEDITVNVTDISLSGADAGNYTIATIASASADITKKSITATATANNKVYDGTTDTTGTIELDGVVVSFNALSIKGGGSSDDVTASGIFTFEDAIVGSNKTVNITGINLSGEDAGNYTVNTTTSSIAAITVKELTATVGDYNKTYGEDNPAFEVEVTGFVSGETAETASNYVTPTASTTATTATGVGTEDITISGGEADNYSFDITATGTLTINKKTLTATAIVDNKVYDGTTSATGTISLTGIIGQDNFNAQLATGGNTGDTVSASATFTFTDKNVGEDKTVNVTSISLIGEDAVNYSVNTTASAIADITKKALTATATANNKVYDGTTTVTGTIELDGVVVSFNALSIKGGGSSDDVTASGTLTFVDAIVGSNKTVNVTGISLSGADADNYTVSTTSAIADITKKALTAIVGDYNKTYGEDNPAFEVEVTGFVNEETAETASSYVAPTVSTTATTATGVGTEDITISGGEADNYSFDTTDTGALSINKKDLTIEVNDYRKYTNARDPEFTVTIDGFVEGDSTEDLSGELEYSREEGETRGVYIVSASGLSSDNYDISYLDGNLTIRKRHSKNNDNNDSNDEQKIIVKTDNKQQSTKTEEEETEEGKKLNIIVDNDYEESSEVILNGQMVKDLEEEETTINVKSNNTEYAIPAEEISISSIAEKLGVDEKDLEEIEVEIISENLNDKDSVKFEQDAESKGYTIIAQPVEFSVKAKTRDSSGKESEVEISKFTSYVKRLVEIPEGIDPSKITTGIVYNSDGSFNHVPTKVIEIDGKYYAEINSLTNSAYSVIWHPITVASVENHWSKEIVNDMASRLVIKDPETFEPDKKITRGDFAEYITKAIGVYRTNVAEEKQFTDVEITDELADAIKTAVEYGIINGYPDGTFKPEKQITREEAMTMYARAMDVVKLAEIDNNRIANYEDALEISEWAYASVKKTISAGVFNGRTNTTIVPKGTFTYAEASTAVRNLLIESGLINK